MAMTKKEQAEMDRLRREAALAKALAWPTFAKPNRKKPLGPLGKICGWEFNVSTLSVDVETNGYGAYRTESEAYRAMIHELARQYAETLAGLYAKAGIEL